MKTFTTALAALLLGWPGSGWAEGVCFDGPCAKAADFKSLLGDLKSAAADLPSEPARTLAGAGDGASAPRYALLRTQADLDAEYCGNDYHVIVEKSPCSAPTNQTLRIYFPADAARPVAQHVRAMEEKRYFERMDPADMFHGHFIIYGRTKQYASLRELLGDVTAYLYHTAEYLERWSEAEGDLPDEKKTPRSLFGKPDGSLIPAIKAVDPKELRGSGYESRGTIYSSDIVDAHPELSKLSYNFGQSEDVTVDFSAGGKRWTCTVDSQFYLRPREDGRFTLAGGRKYDMYILCDLGVRAE